MNRICLIRMAIFLIIALFFTSFAAGAATLRWGASSGEVDGYKVYIGTSPSSTSDSVDVGNVTSYSIDKLPLNDEVQYYFCVTAYNEVGESPPCDPVAYTTQDSTPPAPPTGLMAQ